ncbi:hypothetical protein AVEN_265010-1 [Araneus ventricosus]|uniref:Tesmin/TSO1-like CXC domain-containing protein n=1 Tax=Araneus ventricosus TaxID=182803 RepID=A0A4Y2EQF0_ARAVE|nr:hypothetical protein AVEN_265010-1 [Araneus ventricosus]
MAGPKSAEESHMGWSGFMEIAAGKRCYEKSSVIHLLFVIKSMDIVSSKLMRCPRSGRATSSKLKTRAGYSKPVTCTLLPEPGNLLHLVRCGCKGDCSRNCEGKQSGSYTPLCSECAGESCFNRNICDSEDEYDSKVNYDTEDHVQVKRTSASTRDDYAKRIRL